MEGYTTRQFKLEIMNVFRSRIVSLSRCIEVAQPSLEARRFCAREVTVERRASYREEVFGRYQEDSMMKSMTAGWSTRRSSRRGLGLFEPDEIVVPFQPFTRPATSCFETESQQCPPQLDCLSHNFGEGLAGDGYGDEEEVNN